MKRLTLKDAQKLDRRYWEDDQSVVTENPDLFCLTNLGFVSHTGAVKAMGDMNRLSSYIVVRDRTLRVQDTQRIQSLNDILEAP